MTGGGPAPHSPDPLALELDRRVAAAGVHIHFTHRSPSALRALS